MLVFSPYLRYGMSSHVQLDTGPQCSGLLSASGGELKTGP